jgi:hypothetical protein
VANVTLSHFQARELLAARQADAATVTISPDLGLTTVKVSGQLGGRMRMTSGYDIVAATNHIGRKTVA